MDKITDLRIGDTICDKSTKFPMKVVGLFTGLDDIPNKGTIYADFEGNEGDIWEFGIEEVEFLIENKR